MIYREYKFAVGQDITVANAEGDLHWLRKAAAKELVGIKAKIMTRVRINTDYPTYEYRYTLRIPGFINWYFHEYNLEAFEVGFDAEDIIKNAFNLSG